MSSTINAKEHQGARPAKIERVPIKISAMHMLADVPVNKCNLPEVVVVLISNGTIHQQITLHHPIGVNPLEAKDWVATPTQEMETLKANSVDPAYAKKKSRIAELRQQYAIEKGYYLAKDGKLLIGPEGKSLTGRDLSQIKLDAKSRLDQETAQAKQIYLQDCANRTVKPKEDWKYGKVLESFYEEEFKAFEKTISENFKDDRQDELARINGQPFQTLAGPNSDRSQIAVPTGLNTYTSEQLVDAVRQTLLQPCRGLGAFNPRPSEVGSAFKRCGDDPEKLKEFIFEFFAPTLRPKKAPLVPTKPGSKPGAV